MKRHLITRNLCPDGALVEVLIGPGDALPATGTLPAKAPVKVVALIDTGSPATWIAPWIADKLALPCLWQDTYEAMGGTGVANRYAVSIQVGTDPAFSCPLHAAAASKDCSHEAILGRDFLATVRFLYDGPANRFELRK